MSDRLQLLYEAHGRVNRELPFVVGVLADLAGGRDDLPPLARRRFVPIDRDTRDAIEHWTAVVEARLAAGLRGVLHDPTFQRLEATWLGLWQLVRNVETGPSLKIRVLNVRKAELLADQRRVGGFDQSELF